MDSKAYDYHPRAARGTYKEAKLNQVCQGNADNAKAVSSLGSPILRQMKTIENGFTEGNLWSRMTGRMFRAKSMKVEDLLESLKGVELNDRYAFSKFFAVLPAVEFLKKKNRLLIETALLSKPRFSGGVKASDYLYEMNVLFLDGKGGCVRDVMETEWISFDESLGIYEMEFVIPQGAKYFLLVEGVKGGRNGSGVELFAARGYCIGGWGKY